MIKMGRYRSEKTKHRFFNIVKQKEGKLMSEYYDSQTPVSIRCKRGHTWVVKPNSILNGEWCRVCMNLEKIMNWEFKNILQKKRHVLKYCEKHGIPYEEMGL